MASEWECKCKPRCAGLSECHAPQRVKVEEDPPTCGYCEAAEVANAGDFCSPECERLSREADDDLYADDLGGLLEDRPSHETRV